MSGSFYRQQGDGKNHVNSAIEKLYVAKGILSKLGHYAPVCILRNAYFGIVFSHLQYGITAGGNYYCCKIYGQAPNTAKLHN